MRGLATRFRSVNAGPLRMLDPARARQAAPRPFRAPVGGLMLFDDLSGVPDGGALVLDNWFPLRNTVRVRGGALERNTGIGSSVSAIGSYRAGVVDKAFAFTADGDLFDVSSAGAVGSALVTGLTDTVWSFARFTTGAGTPFLVAAGYGNTRLVYDSTSWATTPAITGVTVSSLSQVWQHANRLFFVEKDTANAWYLATDNIGGAATKFPLGGEFPRGGALLAGATWTTDAGNSGLKSTCVFISENGDVAIYDGADPSSWTKTGSYEIAKPCGINCFMKTGGDLVIMTEDGLFAMSQIVALDRAALANESVSKNILPMWRAAAEASDTALWQITRRDALGMALVSTPQTSTDPAYQFVANLQTGAWARWYGWPATCFSTVGDELIFGTADGRILSGEEGGSDDGEPYTAVWIGPFALKGGRSVMGKMSRAVVRSADTYNPKLTLKFDYDTNPPTAPPAGVSQAGVLWDVAIWDVDVWGRVNTTRQVWQSTPGAGKGAYAPCVQYTISQDEAPQIELIRVDIVTEFGEVVV